MVDYNTNSYYAVVWATTLETKEEIVVKGELICKDTYLSKDPRMLYGNNSNDIAKIRNIFNCEKVEYDVKTTTQSVISWVEVDEYELLRDSRIVVWEGHEDLYLPYDEYRVISQKDFEKMTKDVYKNKDFDLENKGLNGWHEHAEPKLNLKKNILKSAQRDSKEDVGYNADFKSEKGFKVVREFVSKNII